MSLSAEERETIIQYSDSDKLGTVYTCNTALMNKLDKQDNYRMIREYKQEGKTIAKEYEFDKKLISLRTKRVASNMTEEQRAAASERMKRIRAEQLKSKLS